jgi:short-subunit dehydrogenase
MKQTESSGKALVTGASSGIGAHYAERLAERGFNLILVARDQTRLANMAGELGTKHGVEIEVIRADLTQRDDLALLSQRLEADRSITMLVNNAGIASANHLSASSAAEIDSMIDLNVRAVTHLASAAARNFVAQGKGTLINIASVLALAPERSNAIYGATKAYVLNLSMTLSQEVAPNGVRVQVVLPGVTRTEIWARAGFELGNLAPSLVMEVGELVDAALAGLDQGELITIPALPNVDDFRAYDAARRALGPYLSANHAADRYRN